LVSREEYRKVQEGELTWADKLRQEGREEGFAQGERQTLKRLVAAKFGSLPKGVEARIDTLAPEELDRCLERLLTAGSLEEVGLKG
jgi:flagellar biosynthesis/type III secretory pathway protein FliH